MKWVNPEATNKYASKFHIIYSKDNNYRIVLGAGAAWTPYLIIFSLSNCCI